MLVQTAQHAELRERALSTTLFCIPHAGGSATYYTQLSSLFPDSVFFQPLELPGRGRRHRDALLTSMTALCDDLFAQILPVAGDRPYALFGHSMGALLAFLCAVRARERGIPLPRQLFLSAAVAPGDHARTPAYTFPLQQEALWRHIVDLGGVPQCLADSEEFRRYLAPVLHADFTALGLWSPQLPASPLPVPITVLLGNEDGITDEMAQRWKKLTNQRFAIRSFHGNHFYLQNNWAEVAAHITRVLAVDW